MRDLLHYYNGDCQRHYHLHNHHQLADIDSHSLCHICFAATLHILLTYSLGYIRFPAALYILFAYCFFQTLL